MTNNIDKQSFGEAGAVIVQTGNVPIGQYCAMQCITEVTNVTLVTPLLSGLLTGVSFPAGFILYTPIVITTGNTESITGKAVFYKAL